MINCFRNINRETCHICQRLSKELLTFTNDELGWNWRNVCLNCLPEVLAKGDVVLVIWNVLVDTMETKKV